MYIQLLLGRLNYNSMEVSTALFLRQRRSAITHFASPIEPALATSYVPFR